MKKLSASILAVFYTLFFFFSLVISPSTAQAAPANPGPSCGTLSFFQSKSEKTNEGIFDAIVINDGFWMRLNLNPSLVGTSAPLKPGRQYYFRYDIGSDYFLLDSQKVRLERTDNIYVLREKFDFERIPDGPTLYVVDAELEDKGTAPSLCFVQINVPFRNCDKDQDDNCQNVEGETKAQTCIPGSTSGCGSIDTAIGDFSGDPGRLAQQILNVGVALAGGVALTMMILASYRLITSRGNPDAIQSARDLFTAAIIGLIVVIFAVFIIRLIGTTLGIPGISIGNTAFAAELGNFEINDPQGFRFNNQTPGEILSEALPIIFFFAGAVAFLILILGGFKYILANGDQKAVDSARSTITGALKGLLIILGSYVIIQILQAVFRFRITLAPFAAYAQVDLGQELNSPFNTFGELFSSILIVVFPLAGILFFFMLLWGGIKYMLSRGDDKAIQSARSTIWTAFLGLLIIVGSFIIIQIVQGLIGNRII